MLQRARRARYPASSVKQVPTDWKEHMFLRSGEEYLVPEEYRSQVELRCHEIRADLPAGSFDLILCRNLVFTYFDDEVQRQVLERIAGRLVCGGYLVIGKHEALPPGIQRLQPTASRLGIYRCA